MEKGGQLQSIAKVLGVYHLSRSGDARKLAVVYSVQSIARSLGLGELQTLVISKCIEKYPFSCSPSDVVPPNIVGEERRRLLKRVHDAMQRLVKRGLLVKVGRGRYMLKVFLNGGFKREANRLGVESAQGKGGGLGWFNGFVKEMNLGVVVVVRVHALFGGLVDVFRGAELCYVRVRVFRKLFEFLDRWLERYLREAGFSRSRLRKLRRVADVLFSEIVRRAMPRFGVHAFDVEYVDGRWEHREGFVDLIEFESLIRREFLRIVRIYEMGIDLLLNGSDLGEGGGLLKEILGFTKVYVDIFKSLEAYVAS